MMMITLMTTTTTRWRIIKWMMINSKMTTIKVTRGDTPTMIMNRTLSRNVIKKIKTINKMRKIDLERE